MKLLLDGAPVPLPTPGSTTLAGALEAGRARAAERGRIIVEVFADGEPVAHHDLGPGAAAPSGVGEVRLVSEDPRLLVRDALREAAVALDQVRDAQREAAELIHRGRPEDATARLTEVFGVWEGVKRVVDEGGLILSRPLEREAGMDVLLEGLARRLVSVRAMLETSDWAGLADELAFDLDDEADKWRGKMLELSDMLA